MSKWISVKDKLPKFDTKVLLRMIIKGEIYIISGVSTDEEEANFLYYLPPFIYEDDMGMKITFFDNCLYSPQEDSITHWMPLPEPPEKE